MLTYTGKYNKADVMVDSIDEATISQIYSFLNHPAFSGSRIVIMPDTHKGEGSVVGYTATMNDYIIPNVVGVDIGCGVLAVNIGQQNINFEMLDKYIKRNIPSGFAIRQSSAGIYDIKGLTCSESLKHFGSYKLQQDILHLSETLDQNLGRVLGSIGTLGGGNHFIEVDLDNKNNYWVLIHSGSRNFGLRIATHYQNIAEKAMKDEFKGASAYKSLEYLYRDEAAAESYLDAMEVAQKYAKINRRVMAEVIVNFLKAKTIEEIESVHNYIDFKDDMIRKGAISAHKDEKLIIPFNMKDGVAVCTGKGNQDWNYSAPHGAGRIMSRNQAKKNLQLEDFTKDMEGVFTTTANQNTIDESPRAYKDALIIIEAIKDTVDIDFIMKPVYNFKADESPKKKSKETIGE